MSGWGPFRSAVMYGLVGPLFVSAVLLAAILVNGSGGPLPAEGVVDVVISGYVLGLPPMVATGFLTAKNNMNPSSLKGLSTAAALGAVFGSVSALLWTFLGPPRATVSVELIVVLAIGSAAGGLGSSLLAGSILRRRRPAR